jgi:hypothetical protein
MKYWLRHFLICQKMANECLSRKGTEWQNLANLIMEEEQDGKYANAQMTFYFWAADEVVADISASDAIIVFDELEETEYPQSRLATLNEGAMFDLYSKYVLGTTKI